MATRHDGATIVAMAVIASGVATLLHEGVGHGVVAWARGDVPTMLTSNHLDAVRADRWVSAGGTLVNLLVGGVALLGSRGKSVGTLGRYFLFLLAAFNLLPGAGYFLYSGVFDFGDWAEVVRGLPYAGWLRVVMVMFGAGLYAVCVRGLAVALRPFVREERMYNTVGRLPYYAAGAVACAAGAFDPLGWKLFFLSTVAAAFGGTSGLMWADSLMPRAVPEEVLWVGRSRGWMLAGAVFAVVYVVVVGRGIALPHQGTGVR